ncbi:MAG: DUF2298 domain-containing protein [Anaerolineae bacterium]
MGDILAALRWLIVLEAVGLAGLPLTRRLFAHLPDGGSAFARPLALLLGTYLLWLLGMLGFLTVTPMAVLACLAVVLAAGLALGGNWRLTTAERRSLVAGEVVFVAAFALAAFVRAHNPEISATEKPMEFAFLNSILRGETLPPGDPWLSGYSISYYYFGYLMVAALTRLAAVAPGQAFNLGIATLFAMTTAGAFSVVRNLIVISRRRDAMDDTTPTAGGESFGPAATVFGLLGALSLTVMGNLEGFLDAVHSRGLGSAAFWRWLDIKDLLEAPVAGPWLPQRVWWWWRASRVINDRSPLGTPIEVIDEFPFFSFLLGDMHPHVLALPFVVLAVGICLEWALRLHDNPRPAAHRRFLAFAIVSIGALGFLNTWDWPIYLALFAAATFIGLRGADTGARLKGALRLLAIAGIGGALAYLPFFLSFESQASGIVPTLFSATKLRQFAVMFGPFLFVAAAFVGRQVWVQRQAVVRRGLQWWLLLFAVPFLVLAVLCLGLVALPAGQAALQQLSSMDEVRQVVGDRPWSQVILSLLAAKVASPWMLLCVTGIIAGALAVIERRNGAADPPAEDADAAARMDEGHLPADFALALIGIALALTWAVEFVYLRDFFGTRMNTVFKFYYQAWVLLALGCGYGAYYLWSRLRGGSRLLFALPAAALLAAGLVYPALATWTKASGFANAATLDGTRYLAASSPDDYAAIRWLNENVADSPVILEACGGSYSEYARVSSNTGLPTVYGWDFHEIQWRGGSRFQGRQQDVADLYQARTWAEAQALLAEYDVRYVYVGRLEREKYGPTAGELLAQNLTLAFESGSADSGVRIYAVP